MAKHTDGSTTNAFPGAIRIPATTTTPEQSNGLKTTYNAILGVSAMAYATTRVQLRDQIIDRCLKVTTAEERVLIARFLVFGTNPELVPSTLVAAQRAALLELGLTRE